MNDIDSLRVLGPALPPAWLRYRDAFAVLQYLCALSACEAEIGVPWQKVVGELGFSERQGEELLAYLLAVGCVEYRQGQREAALTRKALDYLEWVRGRRRSVRPELSPSGRGGD
jgi:hypothetical protein